MLTFRTARVVLSLEERGLVLEAFRHFDAQRYTLYAVVCMPDHVHAILTPQVKSDGSTWLLGKLVQSVKGYCAHRINARRGRRGSVWQEGYFDHIVRCERDLAEKIRYVWENPLRARLVEDPANYPFSWNRFLHGDDCGSYPL